MEGTPKLNSEVWVDEFGDALFGYAIARVKDRETAEDIVQETFLAAMKPPYNPKNGLRGSLLKKPGCSASLNTS